MLRSILDLQATLMWASGLGVVRIEDLVDYTANGKLVNLASRLCDEAGNGQILVSSKTCIAIEDQVEVEKCEDLDLKGFSKPVVVYDLKRRNTAE